MQQASLERGEDQGSMMPSQEENQLGSKVNMDPRSGSTTS